MPLERLERRQFMTKVRSTLLDRLGQRGGGYMGGPTGGAGTGMMMSSRVGGGESLAERKYRTLYGKGGKGGLLREEIERKRKGGLAKEAREKWGDKLKQEKADRETEAHEHKMAGGEFGFGVGDSPVGGGTTMPGQQAESRQYGGASVSPPAQQAPAPTQQAPAPYSGGTYSYDKGADFTKPIMPSQQPGYKYTLENQFPPQAGFREARTGEMVGAGGKRYTDKAPSAPYVDPFEGRTARPRVSGTLPGQYDPSQAFLPSKQLARQKLKDTEGVNAIADQLKKEFNIEQKADVTAIADALRKAIEEKKKKKPVRKLARGPKTTENQRKMSRTTLAEKWFK